MANDEQLITLQQLLKWLQTSDVTVATWRAKGMPHIKMGKVVRFDRGEVMSWLRDQSAAKQESVV